MDSDKKGIKCKCGNSKWPGSTRCNDCFHKNKNKGGLRYWMPANTLKNGSNRSN